MVQHDRDMEVGEDFAALYRNAAATCRPDQVLHLCYIDRVAYALQSEHRDRFVDDVLAVKPRQTPLVFHRSKLAWSTHPRNYLEIEAMVTTAGEWLLGQSLDFAWCHITLPAAV